VVDAPKPAKVAGAGTFDRVGDTVKLEQGEVTIDSVGTKAASVTHGDTAVSVRGARVKVIAKRGVIAQVHVFAGSAEVTVAGKKVIVEQGTIWDRNGAREDSLAAFRTGWELLRAGDNAGAITAFDQASDDVVAEDAAYWAAIAAERMGNTTDALARFRAFVLRFPKSPRAESATTSIARLSP
jgi:TolA-binding protein